MLAILMYHRAGEGKHSNRPETLRSHFRYLKERYPLLLPGEPCKRRRLNVCLTFDDASYDFYAHIFPLLQEFRIRVVLGVPVAYILESTSVAASIRLGVPYYEAMKTRQDRARAPFCTWEEIQEMVDSGLVEVASHSYSHDNLEREHGSWKRELLASQETLAARLKQHVSTFIYPFGRTHPALQQELVRYYAYSMRIGQALNFGWHASRPLCRIKADNVECIERLFSKKKLFVAGFKAYANECLQR